VLVGDWEAVGEQMVFVMGASKQHCLGIERRALAPREIDQYDASGMSSGSGLAMASAAVMILQYVGKPAGSPFAYGSGPRP
jgi:hypothetical protein